MNLIQYQQTNVIPFLLWSQSVYLILLFVVVFLHYDWNYGKASINTMTSASDFESMFETLLRYSHEKQCTCSVALIPFLFVHECNTQWRGFIQFTSHSCHLPSFELRYALALIEILSWALEMHSNGLGVRALHWIFSFISVSCAWCGMCQPSVTRFYYFMTWFVLFHGPS